MRLTWRRPVGLLGAVGERVTALALISIYLSASHLSAQSPDFTVTTMPESSPTWPAGSTAFYGIPSQTADPLGPWHNLAAVYRGTGAGGSSERLDGAALVYRFRIDFTRPTNVTSVTVHGAGDVVTGGTAAVLRLLDADRNVLGTFSTTHVSCCPPSTPFDASNTYSVRIDGAIGTTFFIDEFDYSTNTRWRDHIEIAYSQAACPTVSTVPFNHGGNAGSVTVQVTGCGFLSGATVKLAGIGPDIVGSPPVIANQFRLATTYNLLGSPPGVRNLVLTNLDGSTATLPGAFTVDEGGAPDISAEIIGRSSLRAGQQQQYFLSLVNGGNVDASSEVVSISVPNPLQLFSEGAPVIDSYETAQGTVVSYLVPALAVQSTVTTPIRLLAPDDPTYAHQSFTLFGQLGSVPMATSTYSAQTLSVQVPRSTSVPRPAATAASPSLSLGPPGTSTLSLLFGPPIFGSCSQPVNDCPACAAQWTVFTNRLNLAIQLQNAQSSDLGAFLSKAALVSSEITQDVLVAAVIADVAADLGAALVADGASQATIAALTQGTSVALQFVYDMTKAAYLNNPEGGFEAARNAGSAVLQYNAVVGALLTTGTSPQRIRELADEVLDKTGQLLSAIDTLKAEYSDLSDLWDERNAARANFLNARDQMCNAAQAYVQCASSMCRGGTTLPTPATNSDFNFPLQTVTSGDPNEKTGSRGVGASQYLPGAIPLRYGVFFANEPPANAPAYFVSVTDTVDKTKVDLSTLTLGPITFVDKVVNPPAVPLSTLGSYTTDVDLRPTQNLIVRVGAYLDQNTGILTWTYDSLDPSTGTRTTDPTAGFLPVNTGGSAFFTAKPNASLTTDSQVDNTASIVFDNHAAMPTNVWSNKLDITPPVSRVASIPANQNTSTFTVGWSGTDVGSGIQDYTVYVSDNGAPFTTWLTNATSTSAMYTGVAGHAYRFYSIARDLVGNVEAAKTLPEAVITISGGVPGDVDGNGVVDCSDIAIIKASLSKSAGEDGFNSAADVNGDQVVDVKDLAFVSQQLPAGTRCQ